MFTDRILLLVIVLAVLFSCGSPPSHPAVTSDDGVEIAYSTEGTGEPALVFVHGWTLNRSHWEEQIRHFSTARQTVAIDLAGHGESGAQRDEWTMASFGGDVAAVIDELRLGRVVLVGHSMGGSVVLEASQRLGERVAGIVLVDAFHDPDQLMSSEEREGILSAFRADFQANVGSMVGEYLLAPGTDSAFAERIVTQMSTFDPTVGLASIEELYRSDYRELLLRIEPPVVAINSALYPTNLDAMTRYGIAVREMSGVGHFPMLENPTVFNEILSDVTRNWR